MPKIRCFLAFEISSELAARTGKLIEHFETAAPEVKWIDPDQVHLTLKFFGDVDENATYEICKVVQSEVAKQDPFQIEVAGVSAFPAVDRPRTVWAGVTEGSDQLCELQKRIDDSLADLGYPTERKRFLPHLTLGRVRDKVSQIGLVTALQERQGEVLGVAGLDKVQLFRSEIKKGGPVYTTLGSCQFGQPVNRYVEGEEY